MKLEHDLFLKNVFYISSLARFNSERYVPLEMFYDFSISSGMIFSKPVDLDDIRKFCLSHREPKKTLEETGKEIIFDRLLMISGAANPSWTMNYVEQRYTSIDSVLFEETGFHVFSLTTVEKIVSGLANLKAKAERLPREIYRFKSESEYRDICFVADPGSVFESKWSHCIVLSEEEIMVDYLQDRSFFDSLYGALSDESKPESKEVSKSRLGEADRVLKFLSNDSTVKESKPFDFLIRPLIKHYSEADKMVYYIAPFPNILASTVQIRLENVIQNSRRLSKADEDVKGRLVETLASYLLPQFPNRNIIKNLRYKIEGVEHETDLLLIMEKSLWAVEIKSHPLFRKIPYEADKLVMTFVEKVQEGINQGKTTLDWISNRNDLLSYLNCDKNPQDMIKGVIVILDGYLPTLMTQNKTVDMLFGTDVTYGEMKESIRIYVLTMLDLYMLSVQPDKDNFEDFLLCRTKYLGKMPLISYEEKEYWAYFNHPGNRKVAEKYFPQMAETGSTIHYISARFNRKDYLSKLDKKKPKKW